ncbi:MAG: M56 family metallopeptidase [Anaerolineae bacterium]
MSDTRRYTNSLGQRERQIRGWLAGSGAFYALLVVAGTSSLALLGLVAGLLPLYVHEIANLCRRSLSALAAHLPAVGAVVPLLGLAFVVGRGGLSLIQQLWDTRQFLQSLPAREHELPVRLRRLAKDLGITNHLDLIRDTRALSFCYGLLRPRICVTTGLLELLDDAELRALMLHERHHLRQYDPLRILLSEVLAGAMGLLPIAHVLTRRYRVAQEVAADQAAIVGCNSEVALSSALLKLLTTERDRLCMPATVGAFSVTQERIARLVYGEEVTSVPSAGAWVATFLIIAGTLLMGYAGLAGMDTLNAFPVECVNTLVLLQ